MIFYSLFLADLYWVCAACHTFIYDKVTLEVDSKRYHVACLRCHSCNQSLEKEEKCYTKLGMLYCKTHYYKYVSCNINPIL